MTAVVVAAGPWMRCGCGKLHAVLFSTTCPSCGAPLNPVTRSCREEPKAAEPVFQEPVPLEAPEEDVRDYSTRTDADGYEWFVCDPYPTYYRRVGKQIMFRDVEKGDAPWSSEPE